MKMLRCQPSRFAWPVGMGLLAALGSSPARAHNGPAYPIVMDRVAPPYVVSVWADPDVGVGTFYVMLAPQPGMAFRAPERVEIAAQPASRRLEEATYQAKLQDESDSTKYFVQVPFDRAGSWRVRVRLRLPAGDAEVAQLVEVTPDDLGKLGILLYAFPFALLGGLWLRGMARERRRRDAQPTDASHPAAQPATKSADGEADRGSGQA